jgi:DNA-binding beta-propeller fold protein YncE
LTAAYTGDGPRVVVTLGDDETLISMIDTATNEQVGFSGV